MKPFTEQIDEILRLETGADARSASPKALYSAVSRAAMQRLRPQWKREPGKKRACYFSAEFLVGRLVHANLFNLGLLDECNRYLLEQKRECENYKLLKSLKTFPMSLMNLSGLLEDPVYWFSLVFSLTRKNKGKLFHSATAILSSSFAEDFFSFREEWA